MIADWAIARPYPNYAAYFTSKGAVPALTRTFAVELAQRNRAIRVNSVLPGPVMLPEKLAEHEVKGAVAGTLLKRPGRPENIAQAVVFLVENDYVTGVCLPVDGGRTIAGENAWVPSPGTDRRLRRGEGCRDCPLALWERGKG